MIQILPWRIFFGVVLTFNHHRVACTLSFWAPGSTRLLLACLVQISSICSFLAVQHLHNVSYDLCPWPLLLIFCNTISPFACRIARTRMCSIYLVDIHWGLASMIGWPRKPTLDPIIMRHSSKQQRHALVATRIALKQTRFNGPQHSESNHVNRQERWDEWGCNKHHTYF